MIQRIQSIFLLAALILQIIFVSVPLANFLMGDYTIAFYAKGFIDSSTGENLLSTLPLLILCWGIPVLSLITILLYKKRMLQMRICIYNILINIGLIGMLYMQLSGFLKVNEVTSYNYGLPMVIPIASIILIFLAYRGIRKDELLVKAYDRLR